MSALLNTLQEGKGKKQGSEEKITARKETGRSVGSWQSSASGPIKGSSEIYWWRGSEEGWARQKSRMKLPLPGLENILPEENRTSGDTKNTIPFEWFVCVRLLESTPHILCQLFLTLNHLVRTQRSNGAQSAQGHGDANWHTQEYLLLSSLAADVLTMHQHHVPGYEGKRWGLEPVNHTTLSDGEQMNKRTWPRDNTSVVGRKRGFLCRESWLSWNIQIHKRRNERKVDEPNQYVFPGLELGKDRSQGKHRPLSQVERK